MTNPATTSSRLTNRHTGQLLLLLTALGWGLNWTVLKFVLQDWTPLFARGVAGVFGATILAGLALYKRESFAVPDGAWPHLMIAAGINVFAWMGFTALSLNWLTVTEGALIAYSMPIWAILIAWPMRGERPTLSAVLALGLGLSGLVVLLGGPQYGGGAKMPGILFALASAILFGLGTVMAHKPIPMAPIARTAWQVGLGCLPMVILGLLIEQPDIPALSGAGVFGLVYMAIGPMAVCYLTWFAALQRLPTSTAATGMLLVPIVGALSAVPLLGDALGLRELAAIALTLGGVGLVLHQPQKSR